MNKIVYGFVAAGLMSVTLTSCKLFKHKTSKKKKEEMAVQAKLLDSASTAIRNETIVDTNAVMMALIDSTAPIWGKRIELKTFSTKAKMHYEGGNKSFDFVANIRMQQDSIIWISVTVAGIVQVARAIITPDSFKAVLYTEKEAYLGPISKVNSIMPAGLDFYSLQNVLLGNPILRETKTVNVAKLDPNWVVRFQNENYIEQSQFDQADSTLRASQLITQGVVKQSLTHVLGNFNVFNQQKIAADRKLNIINDSTALMVEMNYSNIMVNNEQTYPFTIPQNYTIKQ